MAIAKITNTGLATTAALVVVLWSCIVGQHIIVRSANMEGRRALNELQLLRLKYSARTGAGVNARPAGLGLLAGRS